MVHLDFDVAAESLEYAREDLAEAIAEADFDASGNPNLSPYWLEAAIVLSVDDERLLHGSLPVVDVARYLERAIESDCEWLLPGGHVVLRARHAEQERLSLSLVNPFGAEPSVIASKRAFASASREFSGRVKVLVRAEFPELETYPAYARWLKMG